MTQTIRLGQKQKTTQFQIENTTKDTIPVTAAAFARIQNADGTESLPRTKDIRVFPPQLIIPPGEKRTIRIDWTGENKIEKEQAYRIVVEQIPVELEQEKGKGASGIKMLLKYQGALYVTPEKMFSDLKVKKFVLGKKLQVHIRNEGNAHQYLQNLRIKFVHNKKEIIIPEKELKVLNGQNILAETTRIFEFDVPKGLDEKFIGSIAFDK
jgi:fimbrial chaperone protein